ncbi:MAG: enoyl-CoA hydratase/isomerase family protein [Deltaproteobacteria bacterium]|nr:enoyl-CoA hydratase/isomerase family protein [Deltaproteobacteria bacterium]
MGYDNLIYEYDETSGIARLSINRPQVKNALNKSVRKELRMVVDNLKNDYSVKVLIITGAGSDSFIAGADIREFKDAKPIEIEEFASTLGQQLLTDIENLPMPVIAMINGYCFGVGCELAMSCDIRIASDHSKFGQLEINLGLIPGAGGTQKLQRLVGVGKAKELMYTGRIFDAIEAEKIGFVDRLFPQDKLEEEVSKIAETIASKSPLITRLLKKTINMGMNSDLRSGLAYEKVNFALCFGTEDMIEGIDAFFSKRKPEFKGK